MKDRHDKGSVILDARDILALSSRSGAIDEEAWQEDTDLLYDSEPGDNHQEITTVSVNDSRDQAVGHSMDDQIGDGSEKDQKEAQPTKVSPQNQFVDYSPLHSKLSEKQQDETLTLTSLQSSVSDSTPIPPPTSLTRGSNNVTRPGAVRVRPGGVDDSPDYISEDDNLSMSSLNRNEDIESAAAGAPKTVENAVTREELQREAREHVKSQTTEATVLTEQELLEGELKLKRYEQRTKRIHQLCFVGILIVAIVVGTVVGVLQGGRNDSPSSDADIVSPTKTGGILNTTNAPTEAPKISLETFVRSQLTGKYVAALSDADSAAARSYASLVHVLEQRNQSLYAPEDEKSEYFIIQFLFLGIFYFDNGGPNEWTRNDAWMTEAPICSWYGIGCYPNGTLEALRLPNNTLSGVLPAGNQAFENLRVINLEHNQFFSDLAFDPLPSDWGTYVNLEELYLGYNQLGGKIPFHWIEFMSRVRIFDIQQNDLLFAAATHISVGIKSYKEVRTTGNPISQQMLDFRWSPHLRILDLSEGGGEGATTAVIPETFGSGMSWPNITEIYLHNNPTLSGLISSELCSTVMGNDGLIKVDCERVACDCCKCSEQI